MDGEYSFNVYPALLYASETSKDPALTKRLQRVLNQQSSKPQGISVKDTHGIIDLLMKILSDKELSTSTAIYLKPLLPMLVAKMADQICDSNSKVLHDEENVQELMFCLTNLMHKQGLLWTFLLRAFKVNSNTITDILVKDLNSNSKLFASFILSNLMMNDSRHFKPFVNWNKFLPLLYNQSANVKLNSWNAILLAHDVGDTAGTISKSVGSNFDFEVTNEQFINWNIHTNTRQTIFEKDNSLIDNSTINDVSQRTTDNPSIDLSTNDIHNGFVNICGVLLQRTCQGITQSTVCQSELVMTESTKRNLKSLALAVLCHDPVLIEGDMGSGKTFLVEQLASILGFKGTPHVVKLQLGGQTDSKTLLGTYVCTNMPGEFRWQEGVLTQAVKYGSWIILEDIDSAPPDVLSLLIPLIETNCITIPGHGIYKAKSENFQIFATRRSGNPLGHSFTSRMDSLFTKIILETPTRDELIQIVSSRFQSLQEIAPKLVDIYSMLSCDPTLQPLEDTTLSRAFKEKRLYTIRDFMKWCMRISVRVTGSVASVMEDIFPEAVYCFCSPLANQELRSMIAQGIGAKMNINKESVNYYMDHYKPVVNQMVSCFNIGRISLPINRKKTNGHLQDASTYAFTKHSLILLEQIASCALHNEPVLLVGETGCGKTATIQYLSTQCGHHLTVVNMSQQSDSADLLGGFRPTSTRQLVEPIRKKFEDLFLATFSKKQNIKFLGHIQEAYIKGQWSVLLSLIQHCIKSALKKKNEGSAQFSESHWHQLGLEVNDLKKRLQSEKGLVFAFIEGALVKAMRDGDWILLDEVNLAESETLECLSSVLESREGSVLLTERGDMEPVVRHANFRLFACMNPATDIGKRDLPSGIRNRFTEIYVDEMSEDADLRTLVAQYLMDVDNTSPIVDDIVKFYKAVQLEAKERLVDGTGHKPHYSLRTLCRALEFATSSHHPHKIRAIYEGLCMSFLTQLHQSGHTVVESLIRKHVMAHCANQSAILSQPIPCPGNGAKFRKIGNYWIAKGTNNAYVDTKYIVTQSVKANLNILARVISGRKCPVLLQGETSVGKTSMIQYLAKLSGNHCVRINNHEHTDIQEYIGCYSADSDGKLVFKEGVLIDAMRKGYWIILDELNLAPTDVLEALNRLLDDNRELYIAETQETVKAHEGFMLFATQNPPGHYSGRKILSRAFRNRFVELHFDEIPGDELRVILHKRCDLPQSYCKKFVDVMLELQARRKSSGIFAGKHGFITLRDLFRWADRYRLSNKEAGSGRFYDWEQQLSEDGYMLLAGRCRKEDESKVIQEVIEHHFKRKINLAALFGQDGTCCSLTSKDILEKVCAQEYDSFGHLVWTKNLRRMAVLVGRAFQFNEPVLLVGETGCGKTTVCQLFAKLSNQKLHTVNCHMHTEASDFLGGLRPVREKSEQNVGKFFEWQDGPLVSSMKDGSCLLIDEISLADDSVLERLNSVLENERMLVLAEKGGVHDNSGEDIEIITADKSFRVIGTMNPGGDYGKKELSPALRNRFVEIWCPTTEEREDLVNIVNHNLNRNVLSRLPGTGDIIMEFIEWMKEKDFAKRSILSIRDILSWVHFINKTCVVEGEQLMPKTMLTPKQSILHGICLVFIDAIGHSSTGSQNDSLKLLRNQCIQFVEGRLGLEAQEKEKAVISSCSSVFGITPFFITKGDSLGTSSPGYYSLETSSTLSNATKVLRGLQLDRPILLEGSPGAGKTSLISAIAKTAGHSLVRINLSEQTDISDLFGADLPTEGGRPGEFTWVDGPFLKALKEGHWVMLDELNLASQSVLEGLNACFDHRAEIFVAELGKSFTVKHDRTKIFACQNPLGQGGGRKGLPKSFLNRFTKVYVDPLTEDDILFIVSNAYPSVSQNMLESMVRFNAKIHEQVVQQSLWGSKGSPWEFNIRDVLRWCELIVKYQLPDSRNPAEYVSLIYQDRMRALEDKRKVMRVYEDVFGNSEAELEQRSRLCHFSICPISVEVGHSILQRSIVDHSGDQNSKVELQLIRKQLPTLESLMTCIDMNWLAILVGPQSSGKTSMVQILAKLTGHSLKSLHMTSNMDTTELLGGFEQVNVASHMRTDYLEIQGKIREILQRCLIQNESKEKLSILLDLDRKAKDVDLEDLTDSVAASMRLLDNVKELMHSIDAAVDRGSWFREICASLVTELRSFQDRYKSKEIFSQTRGCFEWVDGDLVQALRKGHWLLMENVNLCSPAVLDRLNALLEPGGVLTLDERGVSDGNLPTIVPHQDFRLIFTMDPKYGEISRAMRNRGIEIYIPGEVDHCFLDEIDSRLLMKGAGLDSYAMQSNILNVSNAVKDYSLSGSARISKIAKMAAVLRQRMESDKDAIKIAFHQSIRNSKASNADKEIALQLVEIVETTSTEDDDRLCSCMPSVSDFCRDSLTSKVLRDYYPLLTASDLQQDVLRCLFMEKTSIKDLATRQAIARTFAGEQQASNDYHNYDVIFTGSNFKKITALVDDLCKTADDAIVTDLLEYSSLDPNRCGQLPSILSKFWRSSDSPFEKSKILKLLDELFLASQRFFAELHRNFDFEFLTRYLNAANHFIESSSSLLVMSSLFHQGRIAAVTMPHESVMHLKPFFDAITNLSNAVFTSDVFDHEYLNQISVKLKWVDRFMVLCQSDFGQSKGTPFSWHLLSLHWKWIKEELLQELLRNSNACNFASSVESLKVIAKELDRSLGYHEIHNPYNPSLLDYIGQSHPFKSVEYYQLWNQAMALNDCWSLSKNFEFSNENSDSAHKRTLYDESLKALHGAVIARFGKSSVDVQDLQHSLAQLREELKSVAKLELRQVASLSAKNALASQMQLFFLFSILGGMDEETIDASLRDNMSLLSQFAPSNSMLSVLFSAFLEVITKNDLKFADIKSLNSTLLVSLMARDAKDPIGFDRTASGSYQMVGNDHNTSAVCTPFVIDLIERNCTVSSTTDRPDHTLSWAVDVGTLKGAADDLDALVQFLWINGGSLYPLTINTLCSIFKASLMTVLHTFKPVLQDLFPLFRKEVASLAEFHTLKSLKALISLALKVVQQTKPLLSEDSFEGTVFLGLKHVLENLEQVIPKEEDEPVMGLDEEHTLLLYLFVGLNTALVGTLMYTIGSPHHPFDPVEENTEKLKHLSVEAEMVAEELTVRYAAEHHWSGVSGDLENEDAMFPNHLTSNPMRVGYLKNRKSVLKKHIGDLTGKSAYRPSPPQFESLMQAFKDFQSAVGSDSTVLQLIEQAIEISTRIVVSSSNELCKIVSSSMAVKTSSITDDILKVEGRIEAWQRSSSSFVNRLRKESSAYQDLFNTAILGIAKINFGLDMVLVGITRYKNISTRRIKSKEHDIRGMLQAPCDADYSTAVIAEKLLEHLECYDDDLPSDVFQGRILSLALKHICANCCSNGYLTERIRIAMTLLLQYVAKKWLETKDRQREKEAEESSLFKTRQKVYCEDDEQSTLENDAYLSTFYNDFNDILPQTEFGDGETTPKKATPIVEKKIKDFNECIDAAGLFETFHNIVTSQRMSENDITQMFAQLYSIWIKSINLKGSFIAPSTDATLIPSHVMALGYLSRDTADVGIEAEKENLSFNIYQDSDVKEVKKLHSFLQNFRNRISELMVTYPEQPALQQILKVITKIESIPAYSPLMKFLTGLEILLQQSQDWESYASSQVSIRKDLEVLTEQIIEWRKIELRCWPSLLDAAEKKASRKAFDWFASLIATIDHSGKTVLDKQQLQICADSFQKFIQSSTIAEYDARLKLLYTLQEYARILGYSGLAETLWNLHQYYVQFASYIRDRLAAQRKPIEKELKDFVKIMRWNDINFWAMKQATEKSHRTLRKYIHNFEVVLSDPVASYLKPESIINHRSEGKEKPWISALSPANYITPYQSGKLTDINKETTVFGITVAQLLTKVHRKSLKYMNSSNHGSKIEALDNLTGDVIENIKELSSADVSHLPKEKRMEAIKSIQNRKRRSLHSLFKVLSDVGLSYRKGVNLFHAMTTGVDVIMTAIESSDFEKRDKITMIVEECNSYLFQGLAQFSEFSAALNTPSKDLNPADISRLKGFATHLLHTIKKQRSFASDFLFHLRKTKFLITEVEKITTEDGYQTPIPDPVQSLELMRITKEVLDDAKDKLHGFYMLLGYVPQLAADETASPLPRELIYPAAFWHKGNPSHREVLEIVQENKVKVAHLKNRIDSIIIPALSKSDMKRQLFGWSDIKTVLEVNEALQAVKEANGQVLGNFVSPSGAYTSPFCSSLKALNASIDRYKAVIDASPPVQVLITAQKDSVIEANLESGKDVQGDGAIELPSIVATALHGIQELLKFQDSMMKSIENGNLVEEGADIEDKSITPRDSLEGLLIPDLTEGIISEISTLNTSKVTASLESFVHDICNGHSKDLSFEQTSMCLRDVKVALPILNKLSNLMKFIAIHLMYLLRTTSKMFSVHVRLFTQLLKEGFCAVGDESEAAGEGATEFEDVHGGGLGEGEGAKDVSNEIEDESQLEGTRKSEDQTQDEDDDKKDIPDEKEGIEMSDHFDGKLHDMEDEEQENKETDEENEEEDREDLDKAAGKLDGEEEEKLDEKFWEDSGDESDLNEEEDETKGPGADAVKDSQLVAKDDVQGEQEGNDNEEKDNNEDIPDNNDQLESDKMDVDDQSTQDDRDERTDFDIPDDMNIEDGEEMAEDQQNGPEEEENETEDQRAEKGEEDEEDDVPETENDGQVSDDDAELETSSRQENDEKQDEETPGEEPLLQDKDNKEEARQEAPMSNDGDTSTQISTPSLNSVEEQRQDDAPGASSYEEERTDGDKSGMSVSNSVQDKEKRNSRKDFGRSRENRSLADTVESNAKRQKTTDVAEEPTDQEKDIQNGELYSHIKENEEWDDFAVDTATQEQAKQQNMDDVELEDKEEDDSETNTTSIDTDALSVSAMQRDGKEDLTHVPPPENDDVLMEDADLEADKEDGEHSSHLPSSSTFSSFFSSGLKNPEQPYLKDLEALRSELENYLAERSSTTEVKDNRKAMDNWMKYEVLTANLAQQLSEQLRLVLEPTQASKLQGDYRTGKRLNMRKVIPYIASQFRKDKIWLRRTKKSKRSYQVMLAVDDSSSMSDNHSKQIAFESLAVISNALTWLQAGELSVCRFGETVDLIHRFEDTFNPEAGARVLQQFTFEQKKTQVALLLNTCTAYLLSERTRRQSGSFSSRISQLLLIISDGRGIFLEGKDLVTRTVRMANNAGVFVVFVIMDDPSNRDSIMDIKVPIFSDGKLEIKSYIEEFPFPYYLILNNINALPNVLSDALRQWFEMVAAEN